MLRLINICKSYKFGKNKMVVLNNINIDFKKSEMVFILGASGSGKSTLLNIIGGLVDVTSGSIMLDEMDVTKFDNRMLCNYRNNMIGFIFQDYHLIEYMSVIDNIRLGQTIKSDTNMIEVILRKLGIYSKRKSLVNKLSGGEKQRVAIARAIINNPDIILADEPTGALDSNNGIKIMNILKDISKDKLVIVVSHDEMLASKYADRIIRINDGCVEYYPQIDNKRFRDISKKKISFVSILKMAFKNLCLKKGRTLFTSLAISVGLICMIMVLCLSKSFNEDINNLEKEIVVNFPVSVYNGEFENVDGVSDDRKNINNGIVRKNKLDYVHKNKINREYIDYVKNIDSVSYVRYHYDISMPVISDRYKIVDNSYMSSLSNSKYIDDNYDILYGRNIENINEILLKVDSKNRVDSLLLDAFLIDDDIGYDDIIGRKIKIISNDEYYIKNGDYFYIESDLFKLYKNSELEFEIVGIIREKNIIDDNSMIYYSDKVIEHLIDMNSKSEIVLEQIKRDNNVLGIDNMDRYELLSYLGYESLPAGMDIYVSNVDNKDRLIKMLDAYNDKNSDRKLYYVDTMDDAIDILENIVNIVTVVLIVFSLIGIVVSCMMIFILTNNRVMERVKEIGILRGIGARNKDITRLFNIENMIISIISCLIGILFVYLISKPVNNLIAIFLDDGMFNIYTEILLLCCLFNIFVVIISGFIPAKMASKKKIIDCIYGRM